MTVPADIATPECAPAAICVTLGKLSSMGVGIVSIPDFRANSPFEFELPQDQIRESAVMFVIY